MSSITTNGYVMEYVAGRGRVFVHIHVAEKALGKRLPPRAEVHHWDENKQNNVGSNRDRYQRIKQETDKQGARNGTSTSTQTNK